MRARHTILVLAVLPLAVAAQVLPEGAGRDEVVGALGTPRSRSAAKGREIWLYPEYQVVFEHGRLTSLVALPDEGGRVAWQKRDAGPSVTTADAASGSPAARGRPASTVAATGSRESNPGAMIVSRDAGKLTLRSPDRPPPAPVKKRGSLIPALCTGMLLALGLAAGLVAWRRNVRRQAVASALGNAEPAAPVRGPCGHTQAANFGKPPALEDWELTPELLRIMAWQRFEQLVQRYFIATGLRARTTGVGADGGVDISLYRGRSPRPCTYVRCKSWGHRQVEGWQVREHFDAMVASRVSEGAFVTTGKFKPDAEVFGRQNRIALISGSDFIFRFNRLPHLVRARILEDITSGDYTTPTCPRCDVKLVMRTVPAGQPALWCCRRFPRCHYTMNAPTEEDLAAMVP